MNLVLLGINHRTAPLEIREKLAGGLQDLSAGYQALRHLAGLKEVLLYSTCNRVEVLFTTADPPKTVPRVQTFLINLADLPTEEQERIMYIHQEGEAVQHLFRVASGLDSMVMGEPQILGQVKEAYRLATQQQATGAILNRLLHKTFFVAKRVRSETGIGCQAVSVSYAAVELARKIFGTLTNKTALLVGAGEMAELAVEHLKRYGVSQIIVANRTLERALKLARRFRGDAISLAELECQLLRIDIMISSTGATEQILTRDQIKKAMRLRKQQPLFLIDIAVPRDLDPEINTLDNVYLYNIDDLQGIIEVNRRYRQQEAVRAERIIAAEALKFLQWRESLAVYPTIIALQKKADQICQHELKKTLSQLGPLTPAQIKSLQVLTQSITHKLLHDPILYMKRNHHPKDTSREINYIRRLFNLDQE
ncbi:MAG: glutamyl-tRNA reductase [Deltaproteobacteria bacterium]|nr:MAG: glutamyl-tRNA reductase [Deltaproteobacteria bacterium]